MPRVTYADRLSALAKKPLSNYDRGFVESLAQHYSRKRSMTPGRAAAVKRLEEQYSDEALAQAAANPLNERLAVLADRVDPGTWDAGFVESVSSQVQRGRDLSPKQLEIVSKIEARWTDEARAAANTWKQTYLDSAEMQEKAHIVATYYNITGYYAGLAENILHTEGFVPTEKQYKSITTNKFAKKILEAWFAEPKYPVGSYVVVRDTAPGIVRGKAKNVPCVILKTNAMYPRCAAKGTKIYQVLPFGSPSAIMVEERYVKKARKIGGA
jgi:hypothetical protein